jgi:hypothetical protein
MGIEGTLFFGLLIFAYMFFFLSSKQYLRRENFFSASGTETPRSYTYGPAQVKNRPLLDKYGNLTPAPRPTLQPGDSIEVENQATGDFSRPYSMKRILSVDDYDQDIVYTNEGDRQLAKAQLNELTRAYPFEWSQLPPSATSFQAGQSRWIADLTKSIVPSLSKFAAVEGFSVFPPDFEKAERDEQKLLQTYVPACSKDIKYDMDDAKELIRQIYDKRGQNAKFDVRKDGVYEVYEVQDKDPKIQWEGDAAPEPAPAQGNEATITVPSTVKDLSAGLDPFFNTSPRLRSERTDYTKWTPGLERAFAPTYPTTNWY